MINVLDSIPEYASKKISQMAKGDPDFVSLSIGEPWFGPVPAAREILKEIDSEDESKIAHYLRHYANGRGEACLRELIAERYRRTVGHEIDANRQVLVTHGGSQAFLLALLASTNAGDEVLIPDPTYMLYENACLLLGRVPVRLPKSEEDGLVLNPDVLLRAVNGRARMLVINSPENPTGVVYTREELLVLHAICSNAGITLLQDEVYDSFVFEGEHVSCTSFDNLNNTIQLNSMSKRYGLPGLRIGWLIASEGVISRAAKALEYVSLSVAGLSHIVAESVLRDPGTDLWISETVDEVRARRDFLRSNLQKLGFMFSERSGAGGFFLFPRISTFRSAVGNGSEAPLGDRFAKWIANEAKVAVVPGSVYGRQGNDHIRLVTTVPLNDLVSSVERLGRMVASVPRTAAHS